MKVSIIIPIHNAETYLRECIESALAQKFHQIEVLCVEDESKDASREIIEKMREKDKRVIYIQDSNASYGHKINLGIKLARGKYIAILEADDKINVEMIELLYNIAEEYDVDVVDSDYYEMFSYNGKELMSTVKKYSDVDDYNHVVKYSNKSKKLISYSGIWSALYKKSFLEKENIRLNESAGASYQDVSFLFLTSILAQSVYHLSRPMYCYRVDNEISSVKNNKKIYEIVGECDYLKNELEKRGIKDKYIWNQFYVRKYSAYYWNYRRLSENAGSLFFEKYKEDLSRDIVNAVIDRNAVDSIIYNHTFLLIDNEKAFKDRAYNDKKGMPISKICELFPEIENREIVIFGAGKLGTRIVDILLQNDNKIKKICDNSKILQGKLIRGYEVCSVEDAVKDFPDLLYLIVNRKDSVSMKKQLLKNGINEEKVLIFT